jgi:hypothetical protein
MLSNSNDRFTFTLTRNPVNEREQEVFQAEIEQLGLDSTVWLILNGTIETGTRYSIPKVLRAYHKDGELIGIAYIMECRRIKGFFSNLVLSSLNLPTFPMFIWIRYDVIVDAISNPGFVSNRIRRDDFLTQAIAYLKEKYLYGIVLDKAKAFIDSDCVAAPFCDEGFINLSSQSGLNELFNQQKNLKKKVHKFMNKGGAIQIVRGELSPALREQVIQCLMTVKPLLVSPFQDNYANMVMKACMSQSDHVVHFLARLHNDIVGYHSFALSGDIMFCLSGAFNRTLSTTYHAYENIVIETIKFGLAVGLKSIHYGPILNPTKAKMMNAYSRCEQRYYSRVKLIKNVFPILINFSKTNPQNLTSYIDIQSLHSVEKNN